MSLPVTPKLRSCHFSLPTDPHTTDLTIPLLLHFSLHTLLFPHSTLYCSLTPDLSVLHGFVTPDCWPVRPSAPPHLTPSLPPQCSSPLPTPPGLPPLQSSPLGPSVLPTLARILAPLWPCRYVGGAGGRKGEQQEGSGLGDLLWDAQELPALAGLRLPLPPSPPALFSGNTSDEGGGADVCVPGSHTTPSLSCASPAPSAPVFSGEAFRTGLGA